MTTIAYSIKPPLAGRILLLLGIICISTFSQNGVNGQDGILAIPNWYEELYEQDVVSGKSLGDKQFAYYFMTISERYFTGAEQLAIKVIQDSFDSDPDLFISRVSERFLNFKSR